MNVKSQSSFESTGRLKLLIKIFLIIIIFNINAYSQTILKNQLAFADSLLKIENFFDAVTEYKRLQFFDKNKKYDFTTNYKIAKCYKAGAKFDDAIKYFSISALKAKNGTDFLNSKFQIVRCNILRKTNSNALSLLNKFENDVRFSNSIGKINYWRGWAFMFSGDFERAEYYFSKVSFGKELAQRLHQVEKEKYSVNFAKAISYILPGAGQFYTGNYFSGLLSLGWNVLWGYLTLNAFGQNRIFDGLAVGSLLWLRFYRGNIQNAEEFARIKNRKITNKLLIQIQNNYKGLIP